MSTGFWFANPAQPVQEFLDAFIDLMLHWRDWQIDQLLFNEACPHFLIVNMLKFPAYAKIDFSATGHVQSFIYDTYLRFASLWELSPKCIVCFSQGALHVAGHQERLWGFS